MSDLNTGAVPMSENRSLRHAGWPSLMTREGRLEVVRIVFMAVMAFPLWRACIPVPVLWVSIGIGLYRLVNICLIGLLEVHKVGTAIFVTVATVVALLGGEAAAGAVLLTILLIAGFIADLNMERARASIMDLIGGVPKATPAVATWLTWPACPIASRSVTCRTDLLRERRLSLPESIPNIF